MAVISYYLIIVRPQTFQQTDVSRLTTKEIN